LIQNQKMNIEELIECLVKNPTEELKETYLNFVNTIEYSLLEDAETLPFKSQEYFDQRKQAFAYRKECAIILLNKWVITYGSTSECPVTYADTLNVPFQQIKKPK
jgi:hypothetical protein